MAPLAEAGRKSEDSIGAYLLGINIPSTSENFNATETMMPLREC
ncbi:MAG: hypothetical protein ACTHOU_01730 [Aureliella sp.]